ncbi:NAD(P)/FAD-dependent oxidoreductase [Trinickia violacea]|uniref:NAD(P)/FAD-dependent oxidoreductase n=1 Tax=Trinickia violacea TaxID=2571746 RepID=A0A4P8IS37_9BURK|nr:SidA/IucD/PvdA family monooxygenase [Trinickia violacea]QCP50013.1 NAD(P)/FAD-dependent oxidoreductase [Trinickia violacea]
MAATDTVIIGAGPYGLSLAAHLNASGVPHQIFGKPMQAWSDFMPPGMLMRSEAFASSLYAPQRGYSMKDYCAHKGIRYQPVGMHLSRETFVEYALWFQQNLVSQIRTVEVLDMHRVEGKFHFSLSDGSSLVARRAVLALGLKGFERIPMVLDRLPREYVSHSCEYGNLDWVRDKDIVIVGGGQSALGLAALMHEVGGRIRVLARERNVTWNRTPNSTRGILSKLLKPEGGIGQGWRAHIIAEYPFLFRELRQQLRKEVVNSTWGPSGAWWLRDRVVDRIEVSLGSEVRHAAVENGRVVLRVAVDNQESQIEANHVIAATGFKTDMSRHVFLSNEIVQSMSLVDGVPELTRNFETAVRGLYVIGPASAYSFGPVMRFVYGAKYAAPHVARHISRLYRQDAQTPLTAGCSTATKTTINQAGR